MNHNTRSLSLVLFSVGILLGTILIAIAVWGDLEATLFNPGIQQDAKLTNFRCPVMITSRETATVSARIKNSLDSATSFYVRAYFSEGYVTLMREEISQFSLDPGESRKLEWAVTAEDAAYGRIVLAKVAVRGGYPLPTRQGICGIVLTSIPFLTGRALYTLGVALSLICIAAGGVLWIRMHPEMRGIAMQSTRAMGLMTVSVLVGLVVGLMGWWALGIISLVVILLTTGVLIGYLLQ